MIADGTAALSRVLHRSLRHAFLCTFPKMKGPLNLPVITVPLKQKYRLRYKRPSPSRKHNPDRGVERFAKKLDNVSRSACPFALVPAP